MIRKGKLNDMFDVSVIVPCRNEIRYIRAFLNCIFSQECEGMEMEVLIADGRSEDGTRAVLREFEMKCTDLVILDNPEKIVSAGLNRAIREAKGEIVIRMDVHAEYASDYVRSCVKTLRETNADNVGGPALARAEGYLAQAIAHAFQTRFARGYAKSRDPRYEGPVDSVPYGCWRKSTLERIGLFDETLVRSQDYELNTRLISSGGIVWQSPNIRFWYRPRGSLSGLFSQYFQYGYWKLAVVRKHGRQSTWRNFVPGSCLLGGVALLLCAAAARLDGFEGWRNAFLDAWLALVSLYLVVSFASSFLVAKRKGWRFFPCLPIVFAVYHLSYALGFILALAYRPAAGDRPNRIRKMVTAITR